MCGVKYYSDVSGINILDLHSYNIFGISSWNVDVSAERSFHRIVDAYVTARLLREMYGLLHHNASQLREMMSFKCRTLAFAHYSYRDSSFWIELTCRHSFQICF